ncbi:MAG TPA: GDYXXLXY domain-containing protein [Vicinamibacterales bacterium]|nr:GDYXXLXY domain-containing protein [Vicinamibacterales bacterium]
MARRRLHRRCYESDGTRAAQVEHLRISYGLDAFYMQEGTARAVEDAMPAGRPVQVDVAIAASGRARIRNLIVDGKPLPR